MGERGDIPVGADELVVRTESAQPQNPWLQVVKEAGVPVDLPTRFTDFSGLPQDELRIDEKTGLPFEDKNVRTHIANEFSRAVADGKNWAMAFIDADNLKKANNSSRLLGDCVLRFSPAVVGQRLEALGLPDTARVYLTRPGEGADEAVVWVIGVPDENMDAVKQALAEIPSYPIDIQRPDKDERVQYTFSTSSKVVTSADENVQDIIREATAFLDSNPGQIAYGEYDAIKLYGDEYVKAIKFSKDLERIDLGKLKQSFDVRETLREEFGGSRVGDVLYDITLQIAEDIRDIRRIPFFKVPEESDQVVPYLKGIKIPLPEDMPLIDNLDEIQNIALTYYFQEYMPAEIRKRAAELKPHENGNTSAS